MKAKPSEFAHLRRRRLHMLTGAGVDRRIPEVRTALAGIERTARQYQRSLQRRPHQGVLWKDLAGLNPFSNAISSAYLRLSAMALAWATPGQRLHGSAALLHDVTWGLEWLDAHDFNAHTIENGNWYDFEIAAPWCLVDTITLLGDALTPRQRRRYLRPVRKFDSDPDVIDPAPNHPQTATGANRTDKAMVDLLTGMLLKDARVITTAVNAIRSVFRTVTEGDGFYADGSFVFHGFYPYTGNYGIVLLSDVADASYLLNGTRWDLGARRRATAARWALESFMPLIYRGGMMDMVRGRLISYSSAPSHEVGHRAIAAMMRLSQTTTKADSARLRTQIKRWWAEDTSRSYANGLPLDLVGEARRLRDDRSVAPAAPPSLSHVFASMDRSVHMRPDFGVGISMHSTRIQNYESINGNDLDGWHTSDGMLYLYDADLLQFEDSFWPTVDPERLPGTTAIAGSHPPEGQFGGSSAVGGTSLEKYGAVMMQLNVFQGRLQAKKSWFLFDEEVVALGADIQSTVAGKRIQTIVDNRRLRSARVGPLVRRRGARWATLPASPLSPPIGYFFPGSGQGPGPGSGPGPGPDSTAIRCRRAVRTGSWHDIDDGSPKTPVSATYQTIWIDHGVRPRRARYAYVLLPGKDAAGTEAYAARPAVRVLVNSANAQAVMHQALGITAVSFWTPGTTAAGITADAVCAVMLRRESDCVSIAVSDPTQARTRPIHITIDMAVGETLAADRGVTVVKRAPRLTLSIHTAGSAGRPFYASFAARDGGDWVG